MTALLLGATGLFVYERLRSDLDRAIDAGLRSRAGDISALVQQSDSGLREAAGPRGGPETRFAQILDARGRIFDATPGLRRQPLLTPAELRAALSRPIVLPRIRAPRSREPVRVLAEPVRAQERRLVVVAGAALTARDHALSNLAALLLTGGGAALLLTSLAGYGLASAALRPVESMRRQAASISAQRPGERLPLSPSRDELQRLGRTLNEMLARLEGALERQRAFTADASHELRTPLAILRTELDLIARDRPTGPDLGRAVDSAVEEAERLARLITDLLVLARSDSDQLPMTAEDVDAATLLKRVRDRYANLEDAPAMAVDAPGGLVLRGDPARLEQAVGNLVTNAMQHGRPPIRLAAEARGQMAELHVRDGGDGMNGAFRKRAFERFTRARSASGTGGAGLGLAIVRAVANAHGGEAHAGPAPEGGADVWFTVPVARDGRRPGARRGRSGVVQGQATMLPGPGRPALPRHGVAPAVEMPPGPQRPEGARDAPQAAPTRRGTEPTAGGAPE